MPERAYGGRADRFLIAFLIAVSFVAILHVGLAPRDPASGVAIIYAPGTTAAETVVRSVGVGARFVRFGGFDFIAIVMPEVPDYVQRALAGSALLAVDPKVLAACLPASFLR
jgi:hypothetical protein